VPELLIFEHVDGVLYGQCSACNQSFELVLISSDLDNRLELQRQFLAHLNLLHHG